MHQKKLIVLVGIALVITAVASTLSGCGKSKASQPATLTASSVETSSAVVNGKIDGHDTVGDYGMKLGQKAQADSLELSVTKVEPGSTNSVQTTAITYTATNKGTAVATIDSQSWSAIDRSQGDVTQFGGVAAGGKESIPPGQTITQTLLFESTSIGRIVYSADDANATQLTWKIP